MHIEIWLCMEGGAETIYEDYNTIYCRFAGDLFVLWRYIYYLRSLSFLLNLCIKDRTQSSIICKSQICVFAASAEFLSC